MRLNLIILVLVLMSTIPAFAQTATPTPCTPGVDIGNLNVGGNCRSNSVDPSLKSDLYRSMATAAANVNALPEQVRSSGPDGSSVLPSTSGASQLFGYIKWVFSSNSRQELLGKTLAPLGETLWTVLSLVIGMAAVYWAIRIITLIIKTVVWVFNQFLKLIPFW